MKKDTLLSLSDAELDDFAETVGAETKSLPHDEKVETILHRQHRIVHVTVLGLDVEVDASKFNDMRNSKLEFDATRVDGVIEAARFLFGDEQEKRIREHITDENGAQDTIAYAYIVEKAVEEVNGKN